MRPYRTLQVHQNVDVWVTMLAPGHRREFRLRPGRHACVHVARGTVVINGTELREGDGAAVSNEETLAFLGTESAEILLFDM